jgi:hypothetical protein
VRGVLFSLKEVVRDRFNVSDPGEAVLCRVEKDAQAIIYFFFAGGARVPFLVAKLASDPVHNAALKSEYESLVKAAGILLASTTGAVPRTHGEGELLGHYYFLQDFVPGNVIDEVLDAGGGGRRHLESRLGLAWKWLMDFQSATQSGVGRISEFGFGSFIERYRRAYRLTERELVRLAELEGALSAMRDRTVENVACHGDLFPGNVIIREGRAVVIDWRFFKSAYHPVFDVATFVSTFRCTRDASIGEEEVEKHFDGLLFGEHWAGKRFAGFVSSGFARGAAMPRDVFLLLFELTLLEWTTREYAAGGRVTEKDAVWRRRFVHFIAHRDRFVLARAFE